MTDQLSLPSGLVTFMFTDIVGSTEIKRAMPQQLSHDQQEAYRSEIKAPHDGVILERVDARGGNVVSDRGDGYMIVFADPEKAVLCAVEIQQRMVHAAVRTPIGPLQIRIGLSCGQATPSGQNYTCSAADKAARAESNGKPDKVFLTRETHEVIRGKVRGISTSSAGRFVLKGITNVPDEELFIAFFDDAEPVSPTPARVPAQSASQSLFQHHVQGVDPSPVIPGATRSSVPKAIGGRELKLYGLEPALRDTAAKLAEAPFLLVYGMRGAGKSALIGALSELPPLSGKGSVRLTGNVNTTPDEVFRQLAPSLGEGAEFPSAPRGTVAEIATEIRHRYPEIQPAWIWLDRAHSLLTPSGFRLPALRNLFLGLQAAAGAQWHWVFEFRERTPQGLLGEGAREFEVRGIDQASLAECLADAAPTGRKSDWLFTGKELKRLFRRLGGGRGAQAHAYATRLLIEVARARGETPIEALERHTDDFDQRIEDVLLGDLFVNVLNGDERHFLECLSLYRGAIPHDHLEGLERLLKLPSASDGIDRRCLLASSVNQEEYYLHSFIAAWVRTRQLGYSGLGEEDEPSFADTTTAQTKDHVETLHAAIASCWLDQLRGSKRLTNVNITRAVEGFYHVVAAGDSSRVQAIAVDLLRGNAEWARRTMKDLQERLFARGAPREEQLAALLYRAALDENDHAVQRFLGECWQKVEGAASQKALECFENACRLNPDYPQYLANLGKTLLARGPQGASAFLSRVALAERDYPRAIDSFVRAIQAHCFAMMGATQPAAALRMTEIRAGSRNAAFYNDEAKARLDAGDATGALEVLDLAQTHGAVDNYTWSIRASVLQQSDPTAASALRMAEIRAGSRNAAFYNDEAKARLDAGDATGALEVLDLAQTLGVADDYTLSIRASVLQQCDPAAAAALRMTEIRAGSKNAFFYADEAKRRLDAGDATGALEVLDLAQTHGAENDYTRSIRASVLQRAPR